MSYLWIVGVAWASPPDDARYLLRTGQPERAAEVLERHLAASDEDTAALGLYVQVRRALGEGAVVEWELERWRAAAPGRPATDDLLVAAREPDIELPDTIRGRDRKRLEEAWTAEPTAIRLAAPALWGPDAPPGRHADRLREAVLTLARGSVGSGDPRRIEAAAITFEAAGETAAVATAQARLAEADPATATPAPPPVPAVDHDVALRRYAALPTGPERQAAMGRVLWASGDALGARDAYGSALAAGAGSEAALGYGRAALATGQHLAEAREAVGTAIAAERSLPWRPMGSALWPEDHAAFDRRRRIALGHLDLLRKQLDKALGRPSQPGVAWPLHGSAEALLTQGLARDDRVGTRHLVEAVRMGSGATRAHAVEALEARGAWFPAGLDAHVAAWNAVLLPPRALRQPAVPPSPSWIGRPITDLAPGMSGARLVLAWSGGCAGCLQLLRDLDAVVRALGAADITVALSVDDESTTRALTEGADLSFAVRAAPPAVEALPHLWVAGAEGAVEREISGPMSRSLLARAVHEARWVPDDAAPDAPPIAHRAAARYPTSARWAGAGAATCLGEVEVLASGRPGHIGVTACPGPFVPATRATLADWRWQPAAEESVALVRIVYPPAPPPPRAMPPAACLWSAGFLQDGTPTGVLTTCPAGRVRPGAIPWSEVALSDTHHVGSEEAGSIAIRGLRSPEPCEVVFDVGPTEVDTSLDPGTCPPAVVADTLEAVRSWPWPADRGTLPTRLVLVFVPPEDDPRPWIQPVAP